MTYMVEAAAWFTGTLVVVFAIRRAIEARGGGERGRRAR